MDPYTKPNFRQVGTRPHGSVKKGTFSDHKIQSRQDPALKSASIPSKYETVLHHEATEASGFGNRIHRFSNKQSDLPGPGAYYKPSSMVRSSIDSGSVSKLGYGSGFVSKTKRFSDRIKEKRPDPGQYYQKTSPMNRKSGVNSFAHEPRFRKKDNQIASAPGPGQYNPEPSPTSLSRNVGKAVFSSKLQRGFSASRDGPAPGQYDNPIQFGHSHERRQPQSVFQSTSIRLQDPPKCRTTPGPGAYDAEAAENALKYDWVSKSTASAVFHRTSTDRFGHFPHKATVDDMPGPGSYETMPSPERYQPTIKSDGVNASYSTFRSTTSRSNTFGGQTKVEVPGPAFYQPTISDKRSHLINANKKWL